MVVLCGYSQNGHDYHPLKFGLDVVVHPEWQGQGLGGRLYGHVVAALKEHGPERLSIWTREDLVRSVRFATDRGHTENMREWGSRLDVTAFDPTAFETACTSVRDAGIEIRSLPEIETDEDYLHRLIEVEHAIQIDVPGSDSPLIPTPEQFMASVLSSPTLLPGAYLVAVSGGEYVGMSNLWRVSPDDPEASLGTGLTGVRREYRRRGIATAMKVHALRWCKEQGYSEVRTSNEVDNPMFAINERLGFVKDPAWVEYMKVLREESL